MSVDVTNETVWNIDPEVFSQLGVWVMSQMRVSIQSDLTILFVDPDPIAQLHERWMNLQGPTDVMSFPMDELRAPEPGQEPPRGMLGDIVICPQFTSAQAPENGRDEAEEMQYLLIHGLLHLLGHDHAEAGEREVMFSLNDGLIADWRRSRAAQ